CGQPDQLLLNDGSGHFKPVSWTGGAFLDESGKPLTEPPLDWGLTATFRDVNDDGAPDLYVCNDYWTPDRFWLNDGHGHFRAAPTPTLRKTSASSMSVDFADINRDWYLDFLVVDMLSRYPFLRKRQGFAQPLMATPIGAMNDRPQVMRNTLFLNQRDGTYAEIACFAGLEGSDWSWAPLFLDVDLDGYEDLLIGAGHFRDVQDYDAEEQVQARQHSWNGYRSEAERQKAFTKELMENYHLYPLLRMPIGAFRNRRDCTFEEVTEELGLNHLGVHQGLALADFDGDGDMDLIVNNLNSPAMLFRNDTTNGRVAVRLKGLAPNTQAIGAKVSLRNGAIKEQTAEIICGGHYQSGCDSERVFASGNVSQGMQIEVRWRSGTQTMIPDVRANRLYEISETPGAVKSFARPSPGAPLFEDTSGLLAHSHAQAGFDDYERQPLLPFKLSQLGPGVAWFDLDGDGHEDLVIGAGRGGTTG
ncbi:MAG: FG-GAP-like repeat-containing protein, partial [Limisphaerales bacterium]